VDARAEPNVLAIATAPGTSTFQICVPGLDSGKLSRDRWSLPGLDVCVETDARAFILKRGKPAGAPSVSPRVICPVVSRPFCR
jgi:hypothetical protein